MDFFTVPTITMRVLFVFMVLEHGRRKVLFGSNHPAWPAADCLEDLPSLGLDDETTDLFLHGNAERVFGLPRG